MKKLLWPMMSLLLVSAWGCSKNGDNNTNPPASGYMVTTLPGSFIGPTGVAVDPSGNVYVTDATNRIGRISGGSVNNAYCGTGNHGMVDGPASSASFWSPGGLAADATGAIYVADPGNNAIRKITADGNVSTVAGGGNGGAGYIDGNIADARFSQPSGVAVDASGQIYVADRGNKKIRKISSGIVTTLASGYSFNNPVTIACDANGNVFVGDSFQILKISSAGQVSIVGREGELYYPTGLAVNSQGDVFFSKGMYNSIGKITPAGTVTIIAGTDKVQGGYADGNGNTALFDYPGWLCLDAQGNIYVADYGNSKIRKVSSK